MCVCVGGLFCFVFVFPSNLSFPGHKHVSSLFTHIELKKIGWDKTYATAMHTRHVNDVTDTVNMAALTAVFSRLSNVDFN